MVRKEDIGFYCGFSRKELQSLCKKYNLPANRSSSDMAESLAFYFEKNNLNLGVFGVGGIQSSSSAASGALANGTGDAKNDCYGDELEVLREDCSPSTMARESGCILKDKTRYQDPLGDLNKSAYGSQFTRKVNEKDPTANSNEFHGRTDCLLENRKGEADSGEHPQETPCSSSSFEFHVSSEEGISLSVDLNYNPSDWIASMRNEVCVNDSLRLKKPRDSDHAINYPTESKKQKNQSPLNANSGKSKDGHVWPASYDPIMKDNSQASSGLVPCSGSKVDSDDCKKDNGVKLYMPDSSGPGQNVSCAESCSKKCCVVSLDLDCVSSPGKRLTSESIEVAGKYPMSCDIQHNLPFEISGNTSPKSPKTFGNSSTVTRMFPDGGSSEMSSSEAMPYQPNPPHSVDPQMSLIHSSWILNQPAILNYTSTNIRQAKKLPETKCRETGHQVDSEHL